MFKLNKNIRPKSSSDLKNISFQSKKNNIFIEKIKHILNKKTLYKNHSIKLMKHSHIPSTLTISYNNKLNKSLTSNKFNSLKNNIKIKKKYNSNNKNFIFLNSHTKSSVLENLLKQEKNLENKKKKIKTKLVSILNKNIILNKQMLNNLNNIYKFEKEENEKKNILNEKKIFIQENCPCKNGPKNFLINFKSQSFSNFKPTFNYENYYKTPKEIFKKNFSEKELSIIKSSLKYFIPNKKPFNNLKGFLDTTLTDKIKHEDFVKEKLIFEHNIFKEKVKKLNEKIKTISSKNLIYFNKNNLLIKNNINNNNNDKLNNNNEEQIFNKNNNINIIKI